MSDESAVRTEIRNIINDQNGPLFVRLAFHVLASYDTLSQTIAVNFGNRRNKSLKEATEELESVKQNHQWISNSDLWTLAGVVSIEAMGGPIVPWESGRKDAPNGFIGEEHIPRITLNPNEIRKEFVPMGFNDRDIVAFMGAHTVGRCQIKNSEIEGKWTALNNRFTNQYYVNLEKLDNQLEGQSLNQEKNFFPQEVPGMIMLASDLALFRDPKFKEIAQNYAINQQAFFADFAEAFGKLLRRSLNNQSGGSQLDGQYNIFHTDEPPNQQPNLSTSQLTFTPQTSENSSFFVTGKGKDIVGPYDINGLFVLSSSNITFTKSYTHTNRNSDWIFKGQYNQKLFFGKWSNSSNTGNFIIKRVAEVETSLTGNWRGYYFYSTIDICDQMSIDLKFTGDIINGSGSDSIGSFEINGRIPVDCTDNFTKTYHSTQITWNYYGQRKGSEIWGRWGMFGTPNSGVFLIWRHRDEAY